MRSRGLPFTVRGLVLCLVLGLVLTPNPARAAPPAGKTPGSYDDLSGFVDGVLAAQWNQYHLVGAAVTVVQEGKVALARGYGYADLERGQVVNPYRTVFPLASLAKLFTATAVMQLVEAGKLDLHTDINRYLGEYQVPATFPEPITLAHLLSHTAGFEERLIGDFTCLGDEPPTLAEFLQTHSPQRVRPPGEAPAYSNEGIDLAGYIVEQVSGLPFTSYMQERIFEPLTMTRSDFATASPRFVNELAQSYTYHQGEFIPVTRDCFNHLPSGGLYSSANDMARFMLAHLQGGQYKGQAILQPATVAQMQSQLYTFDPRVAGNAHGFWESVRNEQRILYHFGNVAATYSVIALLPEQQMGLFAVYNSDDGATASRALLQTFLDHYHPVRGHPLPTPPVDFATALYVGSYSPLERPFTTLDELGYALLNAVQVQAVGTGSLVTTGLNQPAKTWRVIAPQLFHQANGQELLVFRPDVSGRATYLLFDSDPSIAYVRLPWYETPRFTFSLLAGCALIFLSTLLLWFWYIVRQWRYGPAHQGPRAWLARALAAAMSLTFLADWLGLQWLIQQGDLQYGFSILFTLIVGLGYVGLALLAGVVLFTLLAWQERYWRLLDRLHYTLVAIAGVSFVWLLYHWHILTALVI